MNKSVISFLLGVTLSAVAMSGSAHTGAFVHLFEWSWNAVALECKHVLGPAGYRAVQVSPPQKSIHGPQWWTRYQPISYEIIGRSGTREEFAHMVKQCKKAGVDIYVDAVINHMAAWDRKFPEVPYGANDFHECTKPIDWNDLWSIQNCDLFGLNDLRTEAEYVQDKLAEYLNDLLSMGVAGLRIDAAKHIPAEDIQAILKRLKIQPMVFLEVIGDAAVSTDDYRHLGKITEFNFTNTIGHFYKGRSPLKELQNIGQWPGWTASEDAITFVANHDNQRQNTHNVITHLDGNKVNNLAHVFMLAWPYGYPKVMSSYEWTQHDDGPPQQCATTCFDGWLCEHRNREIANMVMFREVVGDAPVKHWWDNGNNQLAFSRGDLGFVAINGDRGGVMSQHLQTGLAPGIYCDVQSGDFDSKGKCSGRQVVVDEKGHAHVVLAAQTAIALHATAVVVDSDASCKRKMMFLSGSFNEWQQPHRMQCTGGVWQTQVSFKQGDFPKQFIFDINGNGKNIWGDDNLDALADKFGAKIPVITSGEYLIELDDRTGAYQATLLQAISKDYLEVKVRCHNGETYWGQSVYVVGDTPALGEWNPAKAIKLSPSQYPTWSGVAKVPQDQFIEWKCIKRDEYNVTAGLEWQFGANNIFYVEKNKLVEATF